MSIKRFFFCLTLVCISINATSQLNVKDSSARIVIASADAGTYLPAMDLADRFGPLFNLGISANLKMKSQWLLGVEYSFHFGGDVREDTILDELRGVNGHIIADNGIPADVALLHRGHSVILNAGRLFPIIGPNPNSGILCKIGLGYYQHKIRIETPRDHVPQLSGENLKYYDRLSGGIVFNSYIGYVHVSNNKRANFRIGLDFNLAYMKSLRSYDIPSRGPLTEARLDALIGLRVGWIIPIFKRTPKNYY